MRRNQWERRFGGSDFETFRDGQVTEDGGCILAGSTESHGLGGSDLWVIRRCSGGRGQWNLTFSGKEDYEGSSIMADPGRWLINVE